MDDNSDITLDDDLGIVTVSYKELELSYDVDEFYQIVDRVLEENGIGTKITDPDEAFRLTEAAVPGYMTTFSLDAIHTALINDRRDRMLRRYLYEHKLTNCNGTLMTINELGYEDAKRLLYVRAEKAANDLNEYLDIMENDAWDEDREFDRRDEYANLMQQFENMLRASKSLL